MRQTIVGAALALGVLAACDVPPPARFDGQFEVHGALRAMFHQGQTGKVVALDSFVPDPDMFAVGALADLAGEITIADGQVYLSYPDGDSARTEVASHSDAGAALLVASHVSGWIETATRREVTLAQLEDEIAELAAAEGLAPEVRFPFVLEGEVENLQWHVIDGARLQGGGTSHADHLAAAVQLERERSPAKLIGFYSTRDQGVFTHMGSRIHVHCVLEGPVASGHVDDVVVPSGTTVRLPAAYAR